MEPKYPITLKISGHDGVRDIQIKAEKLLKEHGVPSEEVREFWLEITSSNDFSTVFDMCQKYFFLE